MSELVAALALILSSISLTCSIVTLAALRKTERQPAETKETPESPPRFYAPHRPSPIEAMLADMDEDDIALRILGHENQRPKQPS